MDLVLGIDGGGTGCRAALAEAGGKTLGRGEGGAANICTDLAGARENIVAAARRAFEDAGRDPGLMSDTPALLGLAGANVGDFARELEALLPFRQSVVESDVRIAVEGALGGGDGVVAVLGTGTVYMARRDGALRGVGGWGFVLGDQGSGARLGRELMEETLLAHDGVRPGSALTDAALAAFYGDPREAVAWAADAKPGDFGTFARLVFDHGARGDAVAARILDRAIGQIEASLNALEPRRGEPLCVVGGLAPYLAPRLSERFLRSLRPPLGDALSGAVAMAARRFGAGSDPQDVAAEPRLRTRTGA